METQENTSVKLVEFKTTSWCRYVGGDWVWICLNKNGQIRRDRFEVDAVDSDGKITHLANGQRLNFVRFGDLFHDVYFLVGQDRNVLVERKIDAGVPKAEKPKETQSEFTWD